MIIDFLELDHMRELIRNYMKSVGVKRPIRKKEYWESSGFYIGRRVVRFKFESVLHLLTPKQSGALFNKLNRTFGDDYLITIRGDDIHILLHDDKM